MSIKKSIKSPTLPYGEQFKSGNSSTVLAFMYRAILIHANIGYGQFDHLLTEYIQRLFKKSNNVKDRTSLKAGLIKELMSDSMSFKIFIKGIRALKFYKIDFHIRLHRHSMPPIEVVKSIELQDEFDVMEDGLEEEKDGD